MEQAAAEAPAEAPEAVNNIVLTNEQMLFYNLNVIHDIIHDYGFYAPGKRWTKNYKNASQFLPGRYTMTFDYTDEKEAEHEYLKDVLGDKVIYFSTLITHYIIV